MIDIHDYLSLDSPFFISYLVFAISLVFVMFVILTNNRSSSFLEKLNGKGHLIIAVIALNSLVLTFCFINDERNGKKPMCQGCKNLVQYPRGVYEYKKVSNGIPSVEKLIKDMKHIQSSNSSGDPKFKICIKGYCDGYGDDTSKLYKGTTMTGIPFINLETREREIHDFVFNEHKITHDDYARLRALDIYIALLKAGFNKTNSHIELFYDSSQKRGLDHRRVCVAWDVDM